MPHTSPQGSCILQVRTPPGHLLQSCPQDAETTDVLAEDKIARQGEPVTPTSYVPAMKASDALGPSQRTHGYLPITAYMQNYYFAQPGKFVSQFSNAC